MPRSRQAPGRDDAGSAVVVGLLALLVLVAVLLGAFNMVLDEYAKGALRTAVDEGSQAGAVAGSTMACTQAAQRARLGLLPGEFGSQVRVRCTRQGGLMEAVAVGRLPSFLPALPGLQVRLVGVSVLEGQGS